MGNPEPPSDLARAFRELAHERDQLLGGTPALSSRRRVSLHQVAALDRPPRQLSRSLLLAACLMVAGVGLYFGNRPAVETHASAPVGALPRNDRSAFFSNEPLKLQASAAQIASARAPFFALENSSIADAPDSQIGLRLDLPLSAILHD